MGNGSLWEFANFSDAELATAIIAVRDSSVWCDAARPCCRAESGACRP